MARRSLPDDLPDEVRELIEPHLEPDESQLNAIGQVVAKWRDDAKAARKQSGIELIWMACEEAYIGIDDANRAEFGEGRWAKPMSMDGPLTKEGPQKGKPAKSSVYVRLSARYADAGAAKVGEILLPADDKAFSFSETPVPELIEARDNPKHIHTDDGMPLWRPARDGETPKVPLPGQQPAPGETPGATPGGAAPAGAAVTSQAGAVAPPTEPTGAPEPPPGMVPLTTKDIAEEQAEFARKKAKKAEKRIYDWMIECQYAAEMRKVIFDAARLGVGVLKGPVPKITRNMVARRKDGGLEIEVRETVKPVLQWVDVWNIFPDPACGENIHDGDYCLERDFISPAQVRKLLKDPTYIKAQLEKVLVEGPGTGTKGLDDARKPGDNDMAKRKGQFEIWYAYGTISRDDMACIRQATGTPLTKDEVAYDQREVFAIVTLINDHVVKAAFNPLDSGAFPYHSVPWQRRAAHWAGIGVVEQVWTPQRMINGATRAMLDNAGLSAGSQIVVNRDTIEPADGEWALKPNKIWYLAGDYTMPVENAFGMFQVPSTTTELMEIIQYALRLAEESTNIPLVTQGQSGPTQPDTATGMQLQNNNANQLLRSIGYSFDDYITEPKVRLLYEWLLLDPDVPDDEKGDFTINARGSAALVERAIQNQVAAQILPLSLQPAYKLDPAMTMTEYLKAQKFDPRNFKREEAEQARIDAQPPPPPPQVQAAQITAQSREKIAAATNDTVRDRIETEARVELHDIRERSRLALLEYANRHGITLEQAKARLADTAMKLNAQMRMAGMRDQGQGRERGAGGRVKAIRPQRSTQQRGAPRPAPQVATPAMEPPGLAPDGAAFQA